MSKVGKIINWGEMEGCGLDRTIILCMYKSETTVYLYLDLELSYDSNFTTRECPISQENTKNGYIIEE